MVQLWMTIIISGTQFFTTMHYIYYWHYIIIMYHQSVIAITYATVFDLLSHLFFAFASVCTVSELPPNFS